MWMLYYDPLQEQCMLLSTAPPPKASILLCSLNVEHIVLLWVFSRCPFSSVSSIFAVVSLGVHFYHCAFISLVNQFFIRGTTFLIVKLRKSSAVISFNISHVSFSLLSLWFSQHLYLYLPAVDVFLRFCSFLCISLSQV